MSERKVGLALSGGGSRAVAFYYGVIEAFYDLGISDEIRERSTISEGHTFYRHHTSDHSHPSEHLGFYGFPPGKKLITNANI